MTIADTDRLTALIERKHELLAAMIELARRQGEYIEAGEMTELFKLLSAKQRLLGDLRVVEAALAPFKDQSPEQRRWRNPEQRVRCARLIDSCAEKLKEILHHERLGEHRLIVRRNETAEQLQGIHHASRTRAAYDAAAIEGGQLDLTTTE